MSTSGTATTTGTSSSTSGAAPQFVQSSENLDYSGATDTQLSAPALTNVAAGDLLVVGVNYTLPGATDSTGTTITVQDTQSNTFVQIDDVFDPNVGAQSGLRTFYAANVPGGASDQVVVLVSPSCTELSFFVSEYAGASTLVAYQSLTQFSVPTTTDAVSVSLTSATSGTLLWGLSMINTNMGQTLFAGGTGFTARGPAAGSWLYNATVFGRAEDRAPIAGSQLQLATWTLDTSTDTNSTVVLFK